MTLHTLTEPAETAPGAVIGWTSRGPIHLAAGGDGETSVEPDDEGEGEEPTDEWTPPTKEEYERLANRLKSTNRESASRRKLLEENGIDPRTGQRAGQQDEPPAAAEPAAPVVDKDAIKRAATKAAADTEMKYRPKMSRLAIKSALDDSGVLPEYRSLVANSLDVTDVDVDDDGNVIGLDEQITDLKTKYPACFRKPGRSAAEPAPKTRGAETVDGGGKKTPPPQEKKGWLDRIGDQMSGVTPR